MSLHTNPVFAAVDAMMDASLAKTIPTSAGMLTPEQIVSTLMYSSYAANRDAGMTPTQYASMFRDFPVEAYEARYQAEQPKPITYAIQARDGNTITAEPDEEKTYQWFNVNCDARDGYDYPMRYRGNGKWRLVADDCDGNVRLPAGWEDEFSIDAGETVREC